MVKQILSDRTGLYGKPEPGPSILALIGNGLAFVNGDDWVRHRRVVHPAFAMDKLKMMAKTMADCAREVIREWEARATADGERRVQVEVGGQLQELTADVISHTAFGSSYREGKEVFVAQRELQSIAFSAINSTRFPGSQYIPTKTNLRRRHLAKKVRGTLMAIIRERQAAAAKEDSGHGNDLLGLMLEANATDACGSGGENSMTMDEIVDECKTFFFAGHDTTSHLLTWAMFLLGTHPEWQHRLREEVLRECGGGGDTEALPNGDALNKLKLVKSSTKLKAGTVMAGDEQHAFDDNLFADDDGAVRDAAAVRAGEPDGEDGDGGRGARRRASAQGHDDDDTDGDPAPRRGRVGRGRRRVRPAPVPRRREQGGGARRRAAGLLAGAEVVHRAGLRDDGGEDDAGHDPPAVRLRGVAGVRARAARLPHAAAAVRPPDHPQAPGLVGRELIKKAYLQCVQSRLVDTVIWHVSCTSWY
jgi:hypothetical protein